MLSSGTFGKKFLLKQKKTKSSRVTSLAMRKINSTLLRGLTFEPSSLLKRMGTDGSGERILAGTPPGTYQQIREKKAEVLCKPKRYMPVESVTTKGKM